MLRTTRRLNGLKRKDDEEDDAALSHNKANQGQPRPTKAHQGPTGPLISGADQRPPPSCSSTSVTLL